MDVSDIPMDLVVANLDACMRMCYYDFRSALFGFQPRLYFAALQASSMPQSQQQTRRNLFASHMVDDPAAKKAASVVALRLLGNHIAEHVLVGVSPDAAWATTFFCFVNWLRIPGAEAITLYEYDDGVDLYLSSDLTPLPLERLKRWIVQGACLYPHSSAAGRTNALQGAMQVIFTNRADYRRTFQDTDYPEEEPAFWFEKVPPSCLADVEEAGGGFVDPSKVARQSSIVTRLRLASHASATLQVKNSILFDGEESADRVLFGPIRRDGASMKYSCVGFNQRTCIVASEPRVVLPVAVKTLHQPPHTLGPMPGSPQAVFGLRTPCIMPTEACVGYLMTRLVASGITPHSIMLYTHVWLKTLNCMLVMEQADTTLQELCAPGPSTEARVRIIALQLLQVMLAAAQVGLVHNDMKMANVGVLIVDPASSYAYQVDHRVYVVPTKGVCVVVLDFGKMVFGHSGFPVMFENYLTVMQAMCAKTMSKPLYEEIRAVVAKVQFSAQPPTAVFHKLCEAWGIESHSHAPEGTKTFQLGEPVTLNPCLEGYLLQPPLAASTSGGASASASAAAAAGAPAGAGSSAGPSSVDAAVDASAACVNGGAAFALTPNAITERLEKVFAATWSIRSMPSAAPARSAPKRTRLRGGLQK